ncbi:MAG: OmpA family protein, partial [candidate division KSB1 bacterium]|nr:OmpA family protein [candidate division KSB1 bacterium]
MKFFCRRLFGILQIGIFVFIFALDGMNQTAPAQSYALPEAWSKYDFIPGHQLLFYDDLSGDRPGEMPAAWQLISGKVETIEFANLKWLRAIDESYVAPRLTALPRQFTLEMDFYVTPRGYSGNYRLDIYGARDEDWVALTLEDLGAYIHTSAGLSLEHALELTKGRHRLAMMVDGGGFTCYIDSLRVITLPKTWDFQPSSLEILMPGGVQEGDNRCLITNFRLAVAGKSFREQLAAQGKIVSYGIYFTIGAAQLLPASYATLKEIATLLHNDLRLRLSIECHANDLPEADDNLRLSQDRAEIIREALTNLFKIDRSRLSTNGWGAGRPLEDENTVIGHAINRR